MKVTVNLRYQGKLVETLFQNVQADAEGRGHMTIDLDQTVRLEIAPDIINQTEANIACERRPLPASVNRKPVTDPPTEHPPCKPS